MVTPFPPTSTLRAFLQVVQLQADCLDQKGSEYKLFRGWAALRQAGPHYTQYIQLAGSYCSW